GGGAGQGPDSRQFGQSGLGAHGRGGRNAALPGPARQLGGDRRRAAALWPAPHSRRYRIRHRLPGFGRGGAGKRRGLDGESNACELGGFAPMSASTRPTPLDGTPKVQISLDFETLADALPVAEIAVRAGVDWLEVGTPLILGEGLHAVRALKK